MKNIGNKYEEKAVQLLLKKRYIIYGRNIHINRREIDILAIDDQVTVIVEVKYRKQYFPKLSQRQIDNLLEIGSLLMELDPALPPLWRIDLIVFLDQEIYHYKNVYLT